ncbi:hypothetical protein Pmani_022106 [Petrolisthes manimaculis]|uniref:Carboxylic ester hydrolase n=1 Tax=Petrolisthes manimaculis TaxID=1843537 RepID=A0AAE1U4R5_9EUCA|nr:hypothetical protein Pmani_022106 [Petrolisthes manimaculis]
MRFLRPLTTILTLVVAGICVASDPSSTSSVDRVVVTTKDGLVSGIQQSSTKGHPFYSFWSIPYAVPPVGDLRLQDPVPVKKWDGVKDVSNVPQLCSQISFLSIVARDWVYEGSEDCLYLAVFTPKPSDVKAKLPVMVFIHGGGFLAGGINKYTPYVFMDYDVILVLLQYRVGILGFLSTEDSVMSGNYGLKDQTLALRWIQQNIASFGGDPEKVTLFGQSAGGASVHFHYLSPHSQGLFTRGILEAGTLFSPWAMGSAFKEVAQYTGKLFECQNVTGIPSGEASQQLLHCLQQVDVEQLTRSIAPHILFNFNPALVGPRIDGDYLPATPEELMVQGRHSKASLISGVNAHEGGLFAFPLYSSSYMMTSLLENFPVIGPASLDLTWEDQEPERLARTIFDHYVGEVRADVDDADHICQLYGDRHFNVGHDQVSRLHTLNSISHGSQVFLYTLRHHGQYSFGDFYSTQVGNHWVTHADELFYQFTGGSTLWTPLKSQQDLFLRELMLQLWLNFATTGNPTPDDSLGFTWDAVTPDSLHHLNLSLQPAMEPDTRKQTREFWESLPTKQNKILNPDKIIYFPTQPSRPQKHTRNDRDGQRNTMSQNYRDEQGNKRSQRHDATEL